MEEETKVKSTVVSQRVDRLNKDIIPEPIEGKEWRFSKTGWKAFTLLNDEQKQKRKETLAKNRDAKRTKLIETVKKECVEQKEKT